MTWHSQAGQDHWVVEQTGGMLGGFFVDCGAYDGIQTSNTLALERDYGWSGICIEANPELTATLSANREGSLIIPAAVAGHRGKVRFAGDRIIDIGGTQIIVDTLPNMLTLAEAPTVIDYLSVDIEGSDYAALEAMDFDRWHVRLITVEHNAYLEGPDMKNALHAMLTDRGFERVVEDVGCIDPCPPPAYVGAPFEDWYRNRRFL